MTIPPLSLYPQLLFSAALSSYALHLLYQNITRLQQYEKTSEKAAEWSSTAAERLHKTRTTQTSGTISILLSLLTALTLLILVPAPLRASLCALVNAALLLAAQAHMAAFWNERNQTRIPFVQAFNKAIKGSEKVVWILGTLGVSWGVAGVCWAVQGTAGWVGGSWIVLLVWMGVVGVRMVGMLPGGTFWTL